MTNIDEQILKVLTRKLKVAKNMLNWAYEHDDADAKIMFSSKINTLEELISVIVMTINEDND